MVVKIKKNSGFGGLVNYANNPKKNAEIIGANGVLLTDNRSITFSFEMQLNLADKNGKVYRVRNPARHISISFSPQDARFFHGKTGSDFMMQLVREWMEGMKIDPEEVQYVAVRHYDKDHPHCHLILNRINNLGQVISDKNDRYRSAKVSRSIKERYGLTFGDPLNSKVKGARLRGSDRQIQGIKEIVAKAFSDSRDWISFIVALRKDGVSINFKADSKTGRILGVVYMKDGLYVSGSKLAGHGKFAFKNLAVKFGTVNNQTNLIALNPYKDDVGKGADGKAVYLPGRAMVMAQKFKRVVPVSCHSSRDDTCIGRNNDSELWPRRKTMDDDLDDAVSHRMKW